MKSVLISIQPKWCELIASGKKKVEVRKSKPKLEAPFKAYIYCTKNKDMLWILDKPDRDFHSKIASVFTAKSVGGATKANGKVIGEFICDYILRHCEMANADIAEQESCVPREDILKYSNGKEGFGWHISDLVIYDKPRELSEFKKECNGICLNTKKRINCERFLKKGFSCDNLKPLKRPFQSWGYVYEIDT